MVSVIGLIRVKDPLLIILLSSAVVIQEMPFIDNVLKVLLDLVKVNVRVLLLLKALVQVFGFLSLSCTADLVHNHIGYLIHKPFGLCSSHRFGHHSHLIKILS